MDTTAIRNDGNIKLSYICYPSFGLLPLMNVSEKSEIKVFGLLGDFHPERNLVTAFLL
jgi:hypothetical protein